MIRLEELRKLLAAQNRIGNCPECDGYLTHANTCEVEMMLAEIKHGGHVKPEIWTRLVESDGVLYRTELAFLETREVRQRNLATVEWPDGRIEQREIASFSHGHFAEPMPSWYGELLAAEGYVRSDG